jgi:hypothetical protein
MTRRPGAVDCAPMTAADDAYKRAGAEHSVAPPGSFGVARRVRIRSPGSARGASLEPAGQKPCKIKRWAAPPWSIKSLASASCCALVVFQRTPFSRALEEMQVLAEKLAQSSGSGAGVTSVRKT